MHGTIHVIDVIDVIHVIHVIHEWIPIAQHNAQLDSTQVRDAAVLRREAKEKEERRKEEEEEEAKALVLCW
jgi:hypothetical protein